MIEEVAGGPAPEPEDGQYADTSGDTGAPATAAARMPLGTVEGEAPSEWLDAVTELLGRDPVTGLLDTDRLLEMIGWQARALFSHAKTDRAHHDKAALLEQIQSTQAVLNSISAVQHVRIAQYAATAESVDPDYQRPAADDLDSGTGTDGCTGPDGIREHTHPLGHVCEFTDVDLAPVMCWGPMQAVRRIDDAVDAVAKTPRLVDEMGAGRLDATRLAQVTGQLIEAGEATCAQVEHRLLERGITSWTSRQTLHRTRTLVRKLDPAAAKQTRKKRIKDQIGSFTGPGPEHGLTEWNLILPTQQALPAVQAVEDLAKQLHQDTTSDKTLGQCRIDAFCDLLLGHAEISTTLNVLVPIKTSTTAATASTNSTNQTTNTGNDGSTTSSSPDPGAGSGDPSPSGSTCYPRGTATPPGNSPGSGGNGNGNGAGSVTDSWVETMMADYNWDHALKNLIIDLDRHDADDNPNSGDGDGDSDTTGDSTTDTDTGTEPSSRSVHGSHGEPPGETSPNQPTPRGAPPDGGLPESAPPNEATPSEETPNTAPHCADSPARSDHDIAPPDQPPPDSALPDDSVLPDDHNQSGSPPDEPSSEADAGSRHEAPSARARLCLPDVEVPGLGVIPADAVQDMLRTLGTRLTRSLVDWRTGTLVETSCDSYRPTASIRRHVLQRDSHCRFPGCSRPASFCDVDHVTPWPHGATEVANLQCLCRHHHRAKHETRWTVTMTPDGTCTWTSPTGRDYTTHPGSLEVTADLHITPGPPAAPNTAGDVDHPEGELRESDIDQHGSHA